jgi:hypothetical protein
VRLLSYIGLYYNVNKRYEAKPEENINKGRKLPSKLGKVKLPLYTN